MTKKIYAIMVKKMVKVKTPVGFFRWVLKCGGKCGGFYKKNKYKKIIKKLVCLIVQFEENYY